MKNSPFPHLIQTTFMRYLFFLLLLISFASRAQTSDMITKYDTFRNFDEIKWYRKPIIESFRPVNATTKCKHIYVATEQAEVKVKYPPSMKLAIFEAPKTGKHDGQELVCVKCFKVIRQVIDYGNGSESVAGRMISPYVVLDSVNTFPPTGIKKTQQ